jgi:hypothetical protein
MHKNRLAAFGIAASLLGGGVAGIALGAPGFAGAQTADSAATAPADGSAPARPDRTQFLTDTLAPLVSNGTITQVQADAVIAALEAAKPAHDHGGGPGRGGPGNLEAAAVALGVTADELRTALQDGQSLADVASNKGIDVEQVVSALVADLQTRIAEKVSSGDLTQAQADEKLASASERIRAFVNGEAPAPGHHGRGDPGGPPPADGDPAPASSTNA